MNPDLSNPFYALSQYRQRVSERAEKIRRQELHKAAVMRRKKRKNGGKK